MARLLRLCASFHGGLMMSGWSDGEREGRDNGEGARMLRRKRERKREAANRIVKKATEAKWRSTSDNDSRGNCREERTRGENAVPWILSRRLHLYLSPIRLYGIYPPYSLRDSRTTCADKEAKRESCKSEKEWERERERESEEAKQTRMEATGGRRQWLTPRECLEHSRIIVEVSSAPSEMYKRVEIDFSSKTRRNRMMYCTQHLFIKYF